MAAVFRSCRSEQRTGWPLFASLGCGDIGRLHRTSSMTSSLAPMQNAGSFRLFQDHGFLDQAEAASSPNFVPARRELES